MTAKALGFDRPSANSLDSVADRDYVLEYLSALSITSVHLSRLAEEYVLWCSVQFGYARLGDSFSTGSSIMPQKRNPDAAELIRAKSGRVIGSLNALLIVMKGLPMTYGKDMQEDKEPIFDAHDTVMLSLAAMTGMLGDTTFNKERMAADAGKGFSTATDLADWLVRVLGMPFRDAHHVTGAVVKMAEDKGLGLDDLTLDDLQSIEPRIVNAIFEILSVDNSLKSRISVGGTAPSNVVYACAEARKRFL
jgi:argininosuccinate lyase